MPSLSFFESTLHQRCLTPVVQFAPKVPDPRGAVCTKGA